MLGQKKQYNPSLRIMKQLFSASLNSWLLKFVMVICITTASRGRDTTVINTYRAKRESLLEVRPEGEKLCLKIWIWELKETPPRSVKKKKSQQYDIKLNCLYWTTLRRELFRFQSGPKKSKQLIISGLHSFNQFSLQIY